LNRSEIFPLLCYQPARHAGYDFPLAPGISPDIDDDAGGTHERFHGFIEWGHENRGRDKRVEGDIANIRTYAFGIDPDAPCRQVADLKPGAARFGKAQRTLIRPVLAVKKQHFCALPDVALHPAGNGVGEHQVLQRLALEFFRKGSQARREIFLADSNDLPAGLHTCLFCG
jgi:hypothetical protein